MGFLLRPDWGHTPEHRFELAGVVAIGDGAAGGGRAVPGRVTGVHLRRFLENLDGCLGNVLQQGIELLYTKKMSCIDVI